MQQPQTTPFARWMLSLTDASRGKNVRIAELTGLKPDYVSRVISGQIKGNPRASKIAEIAQAMGKDPDQLASEIYAESGTKRPEPGSSDVVVSLTENYYRLWQKHFAHRPSRAQKVLQNLIEQERQGYTDLISDLVALIMKHGPRDAYLEMAEPIKRWEARQARTNGRKRATRT